MPTRILRDGILESDRFDSISPLSELFYRRLMSVVDDYGRFTADIAVLVSRCFPRRPSWADEEMVSLALAECGHAGLLSLYSVSDKNYLEITNFGQRTRYESKYPSPEDVTKDRQSPLKTASRARTPTPTPSLIVSKETFLQKRTLEVVDESTEIFDRFMLVFTVAGVAMNEQDRMRCARMWVMFDPETQALILEDVKRKATDGSWPTAAKTRRPWNYLEGKEWTRVAIPRILPTGTKTNAEEAHDRAAKRFMEGQ